MSSSPAVVAPENLYLTHKWMNMKYNESISLQVDLRLFCCGFSPLGVCGCVLVFCLVFFCFVLFFRIHQMHLCLQGKQ